MVECQVKMTRYKKKLKKKREIEIALAIFCMLYERKRGLPNLCNFLYIKCVFVCV